MNIEEPLQLYVERILSDMIKCLWCNAKGAKKEYKFVYVAYFHLYLKVIKRKDTKYLKMDVWVVVGRVIGKYR